MRGGGARGSRSGGRASSHERFAFADVIAVHRASADPTGLRRARISPRCGGCPVAASTTTPSLLPSSASSGSKAPAHWRRVGVGAGAWRSRRRARSGTRRAPARVADGVVEDSTPAASRDLVAIEHCLLAVPPVDEAIARLPELIRRAAHRVSAVSRSPGDGRRSAHQSWPARRRVSGDEVAITTCVATGWRRTSASPAWCSAGAGKAQAWGDATHRGCRRRFRPAAARVPGFTQVNDEANNRLLTEVTGRPAVAPRPACGCSICTPALCPRFAATDGAARKRPWWSRTSGAGGRTQNAPTRNASRARPVRVPAMPAERAAASLLGYRRALIGGARSDRRGAAACVPAGCGRQAPRLAHAGSCDPL